MDELERAMAGKVGVTLPEVPAHLIVFRIFCHLYVVNSSLKLALLRSYKHLLMSSCFEGPNSFI